MQTEDQVARMRIIALSLPSQEQGDTVAEIDTQWIQEEGKFLLYPVQGWDQLNAGRAEMGLCSITEYKEKMKELYHLEDGDFKDL